MEDQRRLKYERRDYGDNRNIHRDDDRIVCFHMGGGVMSYPGLVYDFGDSPTEKQSEHHIHKSQGDYYSWCEICKSEEICPTCEGTGLFNGNDCLACESSGRRM